MQLSVGGIRKGMLAPFGTTRVIGRGVMQQWSRQVYVRIARTALIFSALQQPVRTVSHNLPARQQLVGPGRGVGRGNNSSLLHIRPCASTDLSQGSSVLLETRECADGSIMYKFGSADQKQQNVDPEAAVGLGPEEDDQGQCPAQSSTEASGQQPTDSPAGPPRTPNSAGPVVVVNGAQRTAVTEDELDSTSDISQKLAGLDVGELTSGPEGTDAPNTRAPAKDLGPPESEEKELRDEAKRDDYAKDETPAYLTSGAAMIPHPEKAARGGEDAFFIEGNRWIGVADGVGGWANEGINAGLYARELMGNCAQLAREAVETNPKTVLVKAFYKTRALGSTTAVVASITNQTLNVVNMGDSGFIIIRDGVLLDGSKPMLRGFNFPYQIGSQGDDPSMAEVYRVSVRKGDVIVLASDGLWDNLFHNVVVEVVNKAVKAGSGPEAVAGKLSQEAHKVGASDEGLTPFAQEAQRVGFRYWGGKMDDITTVVSFVS